MGIVLAPPVLWEESVGGEMCGVEDAEMTLCGSDGAFLWLGGLNRRAGNLCGSQRWDPVL